MRTRKISLAAYVGQDIKIRFHGIWGSSDFWVDLDNINLLSCASSMDLTAAVVPATPGLDDGEATVHVGNGNPPYQYEWSNGSTDQTASGLVTGNYTVTVNDAHGCSDTLNISVGTSSTIEQAGFAKVSLYPNPTSGLATFQAVFGRSVNAQIEILNPIGQRVAYFSTGLTDHISQPIDLHAFPDGLYLIRLSAEGKALTVKLVKD